MPIAGRKVKVGPGTLASVPKLTEQEKLKGLRESFLSALAPPEYIYLDEWSDLYRYLPQESSYEHGRWSTARFPFLRRIMRCLSPQSKARELVVQKGSQLGMTEVMICWLMYITDVAPAPTLYVQGTLDAARAFNSEKFEPAIRVTPRVHYTLGAGKPLELSDSQLSKGFPGGTLGMGGANSDRFLRSRSVCNAAVDEEDTYTKSVGGKERAQGSPVEMIAMRMINYSQVKKMFRASTPVIKETSTIEPAYLAGSQEQYYLPCPFCNPDADRYKSLFVLKWENIKYSKDENPEDGLPKDVYYECPFCKAHIEERYKSWMLEHGRWLSCKGSERGELYEVGDVAYPSFHISSLYSPYGFFSWREIVGKWLQIIRTGDNSLRQVFINQILGETYTLAGSDINPIWLASRCEPYFSEITGEVVNVPTGGLCLTAGVDVQADRIESEVVAWGLFNESWSVDYAVFYGNTFLLGDHEMIDPNTKQPTVWRLLSDYLYRTWVHASEVELPIELTLIDSKYNPENVHIFCKLNEYRRIYPSKGVYGRTKGRGLIGRPKRRHERFGTYQISAYVDELKDAVYSWLSIADPGPGYCHFPETESYTNKYFSGLTAENRVVKIMNGRPVLRWEPSPGKRNEPLDCRCLALAALRFYAPDLHSRNLSNPLQPKSRPVKKSRLLSAGL